MLDENKLNLLLDDTTIEERNIKKKFKGLKKNDGISPIYFKQIGSINEMYIELKFKQAQNMKIANVENSKLKLLLSRIGEYKDLGR